MDRRAFLAASAVAVVAPLVGAPAKAEPTPTSTKPKGSTQIAEAIAANRMAIDFDGSRFSGDGYDWLVRRGSEAQAFLLGEEHGIAENPKLASQLFTALVPSGYRNVAVEISPPMAEILDRILRDEGRSEFERSLTAPVSRVAFFGLREEADWLAAARAASPMKGQALWGLDYEVAADRELISRLALAQKPATARDAMLRLTQASTTSWAKYDQTHNPQFVFSFSGDPRLVRELRSAWPGADAQSRLIMDTLEQTLAINALWVARNGYQSNLLRSKFMRSNLLHYWQGKKPNDRLFMKMGASHLVRGLSMTDIFDIGTLIPELLALSGGRSFHLLVLPGPGTKTANLDPTKFLYVPGNRDEYGEGMDLFDKSVVPGKFTLFDTAPLRPIARSSSGVPLPLWRVIHGFDSVLIMTGSHPSSNL